MSGNRQRGWAALGHGRFDLAEKEFRLVLAEEPDDAHCHAALGLCLAEQEKFDEAEREAKLAIGLGPDVDLTHYVLGRILCDRHRYKEAQAATDEAIRLDPEDANNRLLLARIHSSQERWSDCLAAADAGLAIDPEHDGCTNLRALALTQLGRKDEASATISNALQRSPENSMTHANQGWAFLHSNQPKQALEHFREALRLDPSNDFARSGLLNAIKAENVVFRYVLAFLLFMSRQRAAMQWVMIIGITIGRNILTNVAKAHPELGFIIYPLLTLIAVAIYSTWLANPLMNLVMRAHPQGRHALTRDNHHQATIIGACLLLAGGLFVTEIFLGLEHLPSFMILLLSIPLTSIHDASPGWPRRMSIFAGITFSVIALFSVFTMHLVRISYLQKNLDLIDATLARMLLTLLPVFFYGIFIWAILSVFWISKKQPVR